MAKEIKYKGKIYTVTQPGELIYSDTIFIGRRKQIPQILDQLNGLSEIKSPRAPYLKQKYGITDLEYYIIVVLEGDETKLPRCDYKDPKTGKICKEPKEFRSLTPSINRRQGKQFNIFKDGCHEHINNRAAQIKQSECYKKGITGLQKADRNSKIWRDKLRKHALKQMQDGDSIFSPDSVRRPGLLSVEDYSKLNKGGGFYNGCNTLESRILKDKEIYLQRGKLTDTCHYYFTFLDGNPNIFKLGVTVNIEIRKSMGSYGYLYKDTEILFSSTRDIVSEFEYEVKMKFINDISLGNEGFPISLIKEIMEFIKELANKRMIKLNDCKLYLEKTV